MSTGSPYLRPKTLVRGNHYVWVQSKHSPHEPGARPVVFIEYCPCPALVQVKTEAGEKICCARDEVYDSTNG